jgi:lysozyme family protein
MAQVEKLAAIINHWEGGYVNHPSDPGGHTNKGVTLKSWDAYGYDINKDGQVDLDDLKQITDEDLISFILKPYYWDRWQADRILNQSIANLVVDWLWHSGPKTIALIQDILEVNPDGVVGNITLQALNNYSNQERLFLLIKLRRIKYIDKICNQKPKLNTFKCGWLNRIADFKYLPSVVLMCLFICFTACRSTTGRHVVTPISTSTTEEHEMQAASISQQHVAQTSDTDEYCELYSILNETETLVVAYTLPFKTDTLFNDSTGTLAGWVKCTRQRTVHYSDAVNNRQSNNTLRSDSQFRATQSTLSANVRECNSDTPMHQRFSWIIATVIGLLFMVIIYKYHQHPRV